METAGIETAASIVLFDAPSRVFLSIVMMMIKSSNSTTVVDESCCRLVAILSSIPYLYLAGSSRLEWSGVQASIVLQVHSLSRKAGITRCGSKVHVPSDRSSSYQPPGSVMKECTGTCRWISVLLKFCQ